MTVQDAEELCKLAHAGQFRKDGVTPYYTHPFAVASMMTTDEEKIIALLHDVIEDTETELYADLASSIDELIEEGDYYYINFSENAYVITENIYKALHVLTHNKSDTYLQYLEKIVDTLIKERERQQMFNTWDTPYKLRIPALKVKIADMFHNISDNPSEKAKAKYYEGIKYLLSTL